MDLEIKSSENLESSKTILGICPTCKKKSEFVYLGIQEGTRGKDYILYTCGSCESTISEEYIEILKK